MQVVSMWFERRRTLATGFAVSGSGIGTLVLAQVCVRMFVCVHMHVSGMCMYVCGLSVGALLQQALQRQEVALEQSC